MDPEEHHDSPEAAHPAASGESSGPRSVLIFLRERAGNPPQVRLREAMSGVEASSPRVDPHGAAEHALPGGKGNYRLLGEIARGGMGVVLQGHDTDLGRDVALKVLHADLAGRPEVLQRFVEEAQIGGQLQHPGIVPVYELGLLSDERPFFTMKLVRGRTLAAVLAGRASPADDRRHLLEVFLAVCQTLGYAHSRGVIHRDLKPANIMVGAFGEVQVVDWGLAKVLAQDAGAGEERPRNPIESGSAPGDGAEAGSGPRSLVGSVMGTPAYMPPEQAAGRVDRLDERADVFALGAILCEILTGRPPYDGDDTTVLVHAMEGDLGPALERLSGCRASEELVQLATECLAPEAAARPRDAGILAQRVRSYLEGVEERTRRSEIQAAEMQVRAQEAAVHAADERKARRLTLALSASFVGLLVLAGGGWLYLQSERSERESELASGVSLSLGQARAQTEERRWDAARASLEGARALARTAESPGSWLETIETQADEVGRAQATADFLAGAGEIAQRIDVLFDWAETDEEYATRFTAFGVDVDGSSTAEARAALAARGVGAEVTPVLDRWLVVRRSREREATRNDRRRENLEPVLRLVELANELDDDRWRADLREALVNDDVEVLKGLAEEDLGEQPPSSFALLATALKLAGEREQALRLLLAGASRHPGDYGLRTTLLTHLNLSPVQAGWDRDECVLGLLHGEAALALRPESPGLRLNQYWGFLGLAWDAERRATGEERPLYGQAAIELEAALGREFVPSQNLWRGWVLIGSGHAELGLDALRTLVRRPPPFDHSYGRTPEEWRSWYFSRAGVLLLRGGALEDAVLAFEPLLPQDIGPVTGEWAAARALLRAREGDVEGALGLLEDSLADGRLERLQTAYWIAWSFAQRSPAALLAASGATTAPEIARVQPVLEAIRGVTLDWMEAADAASIGRFRRLASSPPWPRSAPPRESLLAALRHRAGDAEGALEALDEGASTDALAGYLAALALHDLGEPEQARARYGQALARMASADLSSRPWGELFELLALRDEAAEALGIEPAR